jgi:hypothetical protein
MFRDANGQDHTVSEFHAQGSIVELKTLEQLGFNLADGYEFSGWREQGQVPVTSVIMSSDTYVAGVETAIIKPTLSLDKVPVGFNLRGTTWRIDKTIPIPTDGQVRGSAEIPALTFGAGSLLAIANGNTQLAIIISNSTVETNEGNQLVIAYVNWYYTGDTFTIKDDRDYIVTENNLWTGDANNWGFENITQI